MPSKLSSTSRKPPRLAAEVAQPQGEKPAKAGLLTRFAEHVLRRKNAPVTAANLGGPGVVSDEPSPRRSLPAGSPGVQEELPPPAEEAPPPPEQSYADFEAEQRQADTERLVELAALAQAEEARLAELEKAKAQAEASARMKGALHRGADNNELAWVRYVIKEAPALLNCTLSDRGNALMIAVEKGHLDIVRELLGSRHVDVAAQRESDGATALHLAAGSGNLAMVKAILKRPDGAELAGLSDRWGSAAVSRAAEQGHLKIVDALRPHMPAAPQARKLEGPARTACRVFRGPTEYDSLEHNWSNSAGRGPYAFKPQYFKPDFAQWEQLVHSIQTDAQPAARWLISVDGTAGTPFELEVAAQDVVPANDVIRLLVENGVRNIDVWACYAKAGAASLAMRIRHDPLWPALDVPLSVTFHGEETDPSSGTVVVMELNAKLRSLANPASPKEALMAVNSSTKVEFNPRTGQTLAYSFDAPTLDDLDKRLQFLDHSEQQQLVLNYMAKCVYSGQGEALRAILSRYPTLADPNLRLPGNNGGTALASAAEFGWLDMMEVLLSHPATNLEGSHGGFCALADAAFGGQLAAVERLLQHPKTIAAHVTEALARVDRQKHRGVLAALQKWTPQAVVKPKA